MVSGGLPAFHAPGECVTRARIIQRLRAGYKELQKWTERVAPRPLRYAPLPLRARSASPARASSFFEKHVTKFLDVAHDARLHACRCPPDAGEARPAI